MDTMVERVLAQWAPSVAPEETADPLWQLHAYRVARCLDVESVTLRMAFLAQQRRLLLGILKSVQRQGMPPFEQGL